MKSKLNSIVLIPVLLMFCLILAGCPYSSYVPLDDSPQYEISPKILGKWKANSSSDSTWVKFEKKSNEEYNITANLFNLETEDYEIEYFTGYLSIFADHSVLNVKESNRKYYFVVVGTLEGRLYLQPLSDKITEKFHSSAEAKEFFTKELSKPEENIRYDIDEALIDMIKVD